MPVGRFILLATVVVMFWAVDFVVPVDKNGMRAATYALVLASSAAVGIFRGEDANSQAILLLLNITATGAAFMAAWYWMLDEGGFVSPGHAALVLISVVLCGGCVVTALIVAFFKHGSGLWGRATAPHVEVSTVNNVRPESQQAGQPSGLLRSWPYAILQLCGPAPGESLTISPAVSMPFRK